MADSTDMAEDSGPDDDERGPDAVAPARKGARRMANVLLGVVCILLVVIALAWFSRERIADDIIASQLEKNQLPATYRIEKIAGQHQVLRDIVIGDPAHPDLTIERAEVSIAYSFGFPRIAGVALTRPRLYGSYRSGKLSFGSLDPMLFGGPATEPFRLPDIDLAIEDGRALMLTDAGPVGVKADGKGNLRDGFAGNLAAVAPQLALQGCTARDASAYGKLAIAGERPRFSGPLRLATLQCEAQGLALREAALELDARADKDFGGADGTAKLRTRTFAFGKSRAASLALDGRLVLRDQALTGKIAGNAGGVETPGVAVALLGVDGMLRTRDTFQHVEFQGTLDGQGLRQGAGLDAALASAEAGAEATLLGPMIAQVRAALQRERRGSRLGAEFDYRQTGAIYTLVVPQALLRGGSGDTLLALSRFQLGGGDRVPRLTGNFSTGGLGLPRIAGRMEQSGKGGVLLRATMADYRAAGGSLAVPQLAVAQAADGSLGFSGTARMTGRIPGGSASNLALPIEGNWGSNGELALFSRCTTARFDSLALGELTLDRHSLTLCPPRGTAIVRSGAGGLRIAAGTPSLDLTGRFGATPMRLQSGAVGLAWPGFLKASAVDIALGPDATATRFRLSDITARLGSDVTGSFSGVEARLAAVPMDLTGAAGNWRYAAQKLSIADASFDVTDRQNPARFERLVARGATLSLFASRIDAEAVLREPKSDRAVVRAVIRHDLGDASGHADLLVEDLRFDKDLQPDAITRLALGTVANVEGQVRGTGRADWNAQTVTSTGRFTTDNLDLAAAFGPARGVSGTIEFTDLIGMVTAPNQRLRVVSINPGIEVTDGVIDFALRPGSVMHLERAIWPFLGGTLSLEPTDLHLGIAEPRRYVLTIVGLDAAKFIERMQLGNLSATGSFDGQLPLVFDESGGHITGGQLVSRPPGGNVSYVGALTYKDLSPMANFAFDALKSLDYRTMTIGMDGALEGEIVTRVKFDGVKQGAIAKRNFITKSIANLPIQFNVNIRAPFYQLITSVRAMYDPAFIKDPRTLGLVDAQGRPVRKYDNEMQVNGQPVIELPDVQPSASGNKP